MTSRRTKNSPKSGRGLGHVTSTIFGSTVGYPSDSLASCSSEHPTRMALYSQLCVECTKNGLQLSNLCVHFCHMETLGCMVMLPCAAVVQKLVTSIQRACASCIIPDSGINTFSFTPKGASTGSTGRQRRAVFLAHVLLAGVTTLCRL